jgi:hypothetical protein
VKVGDLTFHVDERERQICPGTSLMTCRSTINKARLVALLTPKFVVIGFFEYASVSFEEHVLSLIEEVRVAAPMQ